MKSDLDTLFDKKPHKTDVYMKSNVSTLRWQMWQNKHRSENKSWKKFRPVRDLNPWPLRYQLGAGHYVGSKWTCEVMNKWLWIYENRIFFPGLFSLLPNLKQWSLMPRCMAFIFTSLSTIHTHDFHIFTDKTIIIIKEKWLIIIHNRWNLIIIHQ